MQAADAVQPMSQFDQKAFLDVVNQALEVGVIDLADANKVNAAAQALKRIEDVADKKTLEEKLLVLKTDIQNGIDQKIQEQQEIAGLQTAMNMLLKNKKFTPSAITLKNKIEIEEAEKKVIKFKYGHESALSKFLINEINDEILQLFIKCFSKNSNFADSLKDGDEFKLLNRFLQYLLKNKDVISEETMSNMKEAIDNYIVKYPLSFAFDLHKEMIELKNIIFPAQVKQRNSSAKISAVFVGPGEASPYSSADSLQTLSSSSSRNSYSMEDSSSAPVTPRSNVEQGTNQLSLQVQGPSSGIVFSRRLNPGLTAAADSASDETDVFTKAGKEIIQALTDFYNSLVKVGGAILDAFEKGVECLAKSAKFGCGW